MGDRLRLVNLRWPKPPALLADLAQTPQGQQLSRETFTVTPGDAGEVVVGSLSRWGGSRTVAELRGNASLSVALLIMGDPTLSTQTAQRNSALQRVQNVLESALAANQPDLAIEWRPDGATYSTYWRLRGPVKYGLPYKWAEYASANLFQITVAFPVAPAADCAPMDTFDDFSTDTVTNGDWIQDAGATTVSVSGGSLVPSGTSATLMRYRHARGYAYGDVEVAMKITTGGSVTSGVWAISLGGDTAGADTSLTLKLLAAGTYGLYRRQGGTETLLGSTSALTVSANTSYYMLLRRAGNVLYWRVATSLSWADYAVEPNTYQLAASDLRNAQPGHVGFLVAPASTGERYDDFSARPYVYRGIQTPEHVQLVGAIPGDVPALADIEVTPVVGSSTQPSIFGLVAWSERPQVPNLCTGGNMTDVRTNGVAAGGWSSSAVSGVIGAGTSVARGTGVAAKYGAASVEIICPATTDTGAAFPITRRFKRGRVYAALAWMAAASATTNARLKLGVSGDLATETAQALSAGWKLHAAVWQPTADHDIAYVAAGISAATGTTFDANGVNVVESPTITLSASLTSSQTTLAPWYTPTDLPFLNPDGSLAAPFLVLIDLELVRVNAIAAGVWSIDRAQEGTTAATHAADAFVVVMPPSRQQFEGKGAQPIFGVLEGEYQFIATNGSSTDYRAGGYASTTGGSFLFAVDPSSVPPDDFAEDGVLVELWARVALDPASVGATLIVSANASEKYDPTSTISPVAGATRYTLDYGSAGIDVDDMVEGTSGTLVTTFLRLGVIPMASDPARPQRWNVNIQYSQSSGAGCRCDYLIAVPARNRAATPTGEPNDSNYPSFVPNHVSANAITKTLRADGAGLIRIPRLSTYTQPDAYPDAGLGQEINLPNADCDLVVKLSNIVPNDDTTSVAEMFTAEPFWTAQLHVAVTPRVVAARGA